MNLENTLSGDIDLIHKGPRFWIYRTQWNNQSVIVKTVGSERDSQSLSEILLNESHILQGLNLSGIVKVLDTLNINGKTVLVLEDAGREDLITYHRRKKLSLSESYDIAIALTQSVQLLHEKNVIHRDINPTNIIINDFLRPTLIDFELATSISGSQSGVPGALEGTLLYMAPEQTGRMDRLVDHRTDLYSLGATFYYVLTNSTLFQESDPIEMIRLILAVMPKNPRQIDANIPVSLADIIMKLISKMPENRYQSAKALMVDLQESKERWQKGNSVTFELGREDLVQMLPFPETLYGRSKEILKLNEIVAKVNNGEKKFVSISGVAGIGKTALVNVIAKSFYLNQVLKGKCDQVHTEIPYAALSDACQNYVQTLFLLSKNQIEELAQKINKALYPNGRVLIDVVPELEKLIGVQPPVDVLGPVETENRLHMTFKSFFQILSETEKGLLLFVDDLQWADLASLRLLKSLILDSDIQSLLLVGAYRSEDVGEKHILTKEIEILKQGGEALYELNIMPLTAKDVVEFIRDLLRVDTAAAQGLADIILQKTAGNPFFIKRLLRYLQKTEVLTFDRAVNQWHWINQEVENIEVSENVVDLMIQAIQELPPETQRSLRTMACIGHSTDLDLLALYAEDSLQDIGRTLWPALHEQLILPVRSRSAAYAFVHDRVQQAVYSLLSDAEKTEMHYRIGNKMLTAFAHELEMHIFEVTDQLNLGSRNVSDNQEKTRLAHLNCQAGKKARSNAAFEPALRYFKNAIAYLQNRGWSNNHSLMFAAYIGAAECSFLVGEQVDGNQFAKIALDKAKTKLEKTDVYSLRIMESSLRGDFVAAVEWGRQGVELLGYPIPQDDLAESLAESMNLVSQTVGGRSTEELLLLPETKDPEIIAAIRLYSEILPPAWFSNVQLWPLCNLQIVLLSLNHGYTVSSPTGFAGYAMLLGRIEAYEEAYDFGQFALTKARRYNNAGKESEVLLIMVDFINHWRSSYSESQALFRLGLSKALESGNLLWGSFIISGRLAFWSLIGMNVDSLLQEILTTLEFNRKIGSRPTFQMSLPYRQLVYCLRGETFKQGKLDSDEFEEKLFFKEAQYNPPAIACYRVCQLQAAYIFNNKQDTLDILREGEKFIPYVSCHFADLEFQFYAALVFASHEDLEQLKSYSKKYEVWAKLCPENFLHRHLLIQAEIARLENKSQTNILSLYEQAVTKAGQGSYIHDEALASELCGRFLLRSKIERLAGVYIRNAFQKYSQRGAIAKANLLREEFFDFIQKETTSDNYVVGSNDMKDSFVDMYGLLKSSEKISSELVLDKLLEQLFEIGLKVAGAQRGALILKEEAELLVWAIGSTANALSIEKTVLSRFPQISISVVEHVFETREPVVLSEAWRSGPFVNDPYIITNKIKSILAVPIIRSGKRIGVFYFENNLATKAFTKYRVESLSLLSTQIAAAIENSLLFEKLNLEIERRTRAEREAQFLSAISVLLSESLDYESTLKKVANMAVPHLADWCSVDVMISSGVHVESIQRFVSGPDKTYKDLLSELDICYPANFESQAPPAVVIKTGLAQVISKISESEGHVQNSLGVRSIISVPLVVRNRVLGALTFYAKKAGHFSHANRALTEEIARRCAIAIENAHLYAEAQKSIQLRDDFISIASHELRTPLTPMKMQVKLLKRYLVEAKSDQTIIPLLIKTTEGTDRQLERLSTLVEDMLNVSRLSTDELILDFESFDLSQLLHHLLKHREEFWGKAKSSVVTTIDRNIVGHWDKKRVEQIITNLLTNAIKYGQDKPIEISLNTHGNYAVLKVKDHGIGIAKEDIPKLFQRFVRLVSVKHYGGFGLGLYIVRRIVEAHAGDIEVESELNEGSTFTVRLPLRN